MFLQGQTYQCRIPVCLKPLGTLRVWIQQLWSSSPSSILQKTDSFDWGGLDIEAFASGNEQSGQIVIKALADALGVRIAVKGVRYSMVGRGDRLVFINFPGSLMGRGGHFYA